MVKSETTRIPDVRISVLYGIAFSLLVTHEIDSAFWKEWELFGLPGGIHLFLVLNFLLVLTGVFGFAAVLLRRKIARSASLLMAAAGVLTFAIHGTFLAFGYSQFRTPVSISIIAGLLVISAALAWSELRTKQ